MERKTGEERSIWGIGPKLAAFGGIYILFTIVVTFFFLRSLRFEIFNRILNLVIGLLLVIPGIILAERSITTLKNYYAEDELCKAGIYSYVRHPLYSAWILLIVPGCAIITGYLLTLTSPIVAYVLFKLLIPKEEKKLIEHFGREYKEYKKEVNAVIPKI